MNKSKYSEGFSLIYTLVLILIGSSVLVYLISVLSMHNIEIVRNIDRKKLELACISEANKVICLDSIGTVWNDTITRGKITLIRNLKQRGLFNELFITAKNLRDSVKVSSIIGQCPKNIFANAVVVSYPNLRISAAGATKIIGNFTSTADRISQGRIYGQGTLHAKFLEGDLIKSTNIEAKNFNDSLLIKKFTFPSLEDGKILILSDDFIFNNYNIENLIPGENYFIDGDFKFSGKIEEKLYKDYSTIHLTGKVYIDENVQCNSRLEIISDSSLQINRNCKLKNLVFFCKGTINIDKDTEVENCQFYSQSDIFIDGCKFNYPTVIGSYVDMSDSSNFSNLLSLNNSIINGTIFQISSTTGLSNNKSKIVIDKKSKVQGLVYSENFLELSAPVNGIVYTYAFRNLIEPTEYINWMIDLEINRKQLNDYFLIPTGFNNQTDYRILSEQWIK